ncbi:hypothetical protein GCM10017044_01750 [Kordiimonas sediminis]|uniref:Uncharacterized protein n=1 Tax=Kordiimonas sediminis TaxID=1735581 RepID=A0A919E426_9PROT|nr:hypothetical protein [Kordiimonas sediminis]GHF11604.1 hypothetical protein GCM10017044_01750 [Kordiimonas sediminis]
MKLKVLAVTGLISLLYGCGSNEIDVVKNGRLHEKAAFTIGDIFDNRALCSSTSWDYTTDDKGREVVEYSCTLNGSKALLDLMYHSYANAHAASLSGALQSSQQKLNSLTTRIEENKEKIAKYERGIVSIKDTIPQLEAGMAEAVSDVERQNYSSTLTSRRNEIQQLVRAKEYAMNELEKSEDSYQTLASRIEEEMKAQGPEVSDILDTFKDRFYADDPIFTEYYQWTVQDQSYHLAAAGMRLERDGEVESFVPYGDRGIEEALAIAHGKPIEFSAIEDSKFYFYKADWLLEEYKKSP